MTRMSKNEELMMDADAFKDFFVRKLLLDYSREKLAQKNAVKHAFMHGAMYESDMNKEDAEKIYDKWVKAPNERMAEDKCKADNAFREKWRRK